MKALVLAAGYGTRLYPLTLDIPKPLLRVGSKTIADRLVDKIDKLKDIDEIYVVTNERFSSEFQKWAENRSCSKPIHVINDGTQSNETRLGAIGDMELVVRKAKIADDILIVGGDNLFEFDLRDFVKFAETKGSTTVCLRAVEDLEEAKKYGIVSMDSQDRITEFVEKPKKPKSHLAAMCLYYFPSEKLNLLKTYLGTGKNKDAPGHYISWLAENNTVYGYILKGEWFDIGDKRLLKKADDFYKEREERC